MEAETDKITQAAEACQATAIGQADPFKRASAYLKSLKMQGWTATEIIEVQVLIIRALMGRISAADGDATQARS
jgi:hypothetical protein